MPHSVLSTVSDHYTPRDSGENDDFHASLLMHATPPCDYKRRRRASFRRDASRRDPSSLTLRHPYSPRSTRLLAETWELLSLSRLVCTPYYKHFGCKIIQCPRTPPLLDVRPRGRNQDKPARYCVASCINIWDKETRSITSWDLDRRVRTPTLFFLFFLRKQQDSFTDLPYFY